MRLAVLALFLWLSAGAAQAAELTVAPGGILQLAPAPSGDVARNQGFDAPDPSLKLPGAGALPAGPAADPNAVPRTTLALDRVPSSADTDNYLNSRDFQQSIEPKSSKGHVGAGSQFAGAGKAALLNGLIGLALGGL